MSTGPVRREVVKRTGSPDSHHRTLLECPVLLDRNTRTLTINVMHHRMHQQCLATVRFSLHLCQKQERTRHSGVASDVPLRPVSDECFPREKHSRDFSKLSIGIIENIHFIFSKASNPASQAQWEGERNANSSLAFKLHLLLKVSHPDVKEHSGAKSHVRQDLKFTHMDRHHQWYKTQCSNELHK